MQLELTAARLATLTLAAGNLLVVTAEGPDAVLAALGAAALLATFHLLGKHMLETRDPLVLSFWMFAIS